MNFSIRRSVHFDNFDRWLSGLKGIPIELAPPSDMQEFLSIVARLDELVTYVHDKGLLINSIHAPHGRLSGTSFMGWAQTVMKFAKKVGAVTVVFHPEAHIAKARKPELQAIAIEHIRALQEKTPVIPAVETFQSTSRVLTPEEIIEHGLPMILDTSHLSEQHTLELIKQYSLNIVGVHLSENRIDPVIRGRPLNHLPVEEFGISVLEKLRETGWDGNVTLEYLQQYHDRLAPDRERLERMFG